MSHEKLEIVMPQCADDEIIERVHQIMRRFEQGDGPGSSNRFWDWYVLGGRFAGSKFEASLDQEKLSKFHEVLKEKEITVSSIQAGKPEISPAHLIPVVDQIWNDYFPNSGFAKCPFFKHSNDQFGRNGLGDLLPLDICKLSEVPHDYNARMVMFAGEVDHTQYLGKPKKLFECRYIVQSNFWNGVNFQNAVYDGKFSTALNMYMKYIDGHSYFADLAPKNDWLVITVDFHS